MIRRDPTLDSVARGASRFLSPIAAALVIAGAAAGVAVPGATAPPAGPGPVLDLLRRPDAKPARAPFTRNVATPLPVRRANALATLPLRTSVFVPRAGTSADSEKFPGTLGVISGDGYGSSLATCGDMFGDGISDVAVGAPYLAGPHGLAGGVVFYYGKPADSTQTTTLYGENEFDTFGFSIAGVGDVNGDGYADFLVGAPQHTAGGNASAGKAYLYLGSAIGLSTVPAWTFTTNELSAHVGYSVAWAGDVNGDGYDDWIVGAPGHTNGESGEGAAYLFYGGSGPLSTSPAWTYEPNAAGASFGGSVATAGDVNGDGYADLIVGAPNATNTFAQEGEAMLFFGKGSKPSAAPDKTWYGGQANAFFGSSVATAGDVNGDGYSDLVVGAPFFDDLFSNQGIAWIMYGGPIPVLYSPPQPLEQGFTGAHFGTSVATAGDVNGDGFADVIVGAPGILQILNQGAAFVFLGSKNGLVSSVHTTITSTSSNETIGGAVGTMGDRTGDGLSECWAGAPRNGGPGEAFLAFGAPLAPGMSETFAGQGLVAGQEFPRAAAAADLNGDGFDDLILASNVAGDDPTDEGLVRVYMGSPDPFETVSPYPYITKPADWSYQGDAGDNLGFSLANAGDVNGDGYEDLVVGAPAHSGLFPNEGAALLFYGSPSGVANSPTWRVDGTDSTELVGYSVAAGGDLNGDGYDDVAVGAPYGDLGLPYEGLTRVYYGSQFGLSHVAATVLRANLGSSLMGYASAIVGDINGDGYDDLVVGAPYYSEGETNEGHAFVYLGSPTGVHASPSQTLQINVASAYFGAGVYRIGDVNGDGYADVAIGAPGISDPDISEGELFVYYGSPSGLVDPSGWTLEGNAAGVGMGQYGVAGAGDIDLDGYSDLIVGTPYENDGAANSGRIRVFMGSPGGLASIPRLDEAGFDPDDNLGFGVGGEADFDGDGYPDLFYTAPGFALVGADEGVAILRAGNLLPVPTWNPDRPLAAWRSDDSAPVAPGLRADSQTAFRIKGRGRTAAGRSKLRLEYETKPTGTNFDFTGHGKSSWQAMGPVSGEYGTSAPFDVPVAALASATKYHWRARFQSRSLFFPYTPWMGTERRGGKERHLSTAGAPLAVGVGPSPAGMTDVALAPAAPNPSMGSSTSLAFSLPTPGAARLALYNLRGALVRTLFDAKAVAGTTRVTWDGLDAHGRRAPAGAYFMRLTALGKERVEKLVRLD